MSWDVQLPKLAGYKVEHGDCRSAGPMTGSLAGGSTSGGADVDAGGASEGAGFHLAPT